MEYQSRSNRLPARFRRAGLALAMLVAIALAAIAATPSSAVNPTPRLAAEPPATGTCWLLDTRQWDSLSDMGTQVACESPHVAEVTAVLAVPRVVSRRGWGSGDLQAWLTANCRALNNEYAGVDAELVPPRYLPSSLDAFGTLYVPTRQQWAAGARWSTCVVANVNLVRGRTVPSATTVSLRGIDAEGVNRPWCKRAGTGVMVACSARKARTVDAVVNLSRRPTERYPGNAVLQRRTFESCEAVVGTTEWAWWPANARAWKAGSRTGTCSIG